MFTCQGTRQGLSVPHQHEVVVDARYCYGLLTKAPVPPPGAPYAPVAAPAPAVVRPFAFGSRHNPTGPLSKPQYDYISDLKGDLDHALTLSYYDASCYISTLRGGKAVEPVIEDPKTAMVKGMLPGIKDGYYAVQEYDGGHVDFYRINRPKERTSRTGRRNLNRFAGATKVQSIHGSGLGKRLDLALVMWPSGRDSVYESNVWDKLLLLVADSHGAALRYAEKMKSCCCCNADLTDGRSRWFGIGPECEKKPNWAWVVDTVLDTKGPFIEER